MVKKILISFVGLFVIAAVVLFFFGSGWMNSLVKTGVERVGPRVTGTAVELDSVSLSIFSGSGTLNGFRVANPDGFSEDFIVSLGQMDIKIVPKSLIGDTIIIERLHINAPNILLEQNASGNNLRILQANIDSFSPTPEEQSEQTGAARDVVIQELVIEGGRLRGSLYGQTINMALPRIELQNVGTGEDGLPISDVLNIILGEVMRNAGSVLGDIGGRVGELGGDLAGRGADAVRDVTEGATERIRGLFNRD